MGNNIDTRVLVAELIGTAVLVMGGPGAAILAGDVIGIFGIAVAFGLSLAVMAYVIGPVSGCHINPAVTLGMFLSKKIEQAHAISAWIGQVVGGIIGAIVIFVIGNATDGFERGSFASNGWDRDGFGSFGSMVVVEIVFTALLVFVVLATTSTKFPAAVAGLVAGITLTLIHLVTIPVDNTSVNPARSLATALFADTDPSALGQVWAFIVFPLIGGALGVYLWQVIEHEPGDAPAYDATGND